MKPHCTSVKSLDLDIDGVNITLTNVDFYPSVPATQIDPPEAAFASWDEAFIGGVEVSPLLNITVGIGDYIEQKIIEHFED